MCHLLHRLLSCNNKNKWTNKRWWLWPLGRALWNSREHKPHNTFAVLLKLIWVTSKHSRQHEHPVIYLSLPALEMTPGFVQRHWWIWWWFGTRSQPSGLSQCLGNWPPWSQWLCPHLQLWAGNLWPLAPQSTLQWCYCWVLNMPDQ